MNWVLSDGEGCAEKKRRTKKVRNRIETRTDFLLVKIYAFLKRRIQAVKEGEM